MKSHRHEGIYSIDYYAYVSNIKDWNPGFKVLFAFVVLLLCIALNNVYISLFVIFTMGYTVIFKSGVGFRDYLSLLSIPIAFMILGSIAIAGGISSRPAGDYNLNLYFFYIYSSNESILSAFKIILKALGGISAMYMMTLSTSTSEIISVLRKSHIPKIIIELMNMIYRFIFILMDTQCKMKNSSQSRLGYVDFRTSCYTFGSVASNLLVVSLKKANAYYNAMESRCYNGEIIFLEEEKSIKAVHIYGAVFYFTAMIIIYIITRSMS